MSGSNQAVFLSYASQDAEAVKKICEALRASGVEVWFDQNELTGGDAWDQKIRKQIKECALFVPIISAATQARREGYFRIEWKLAAQRTHAIADGTPFLLPIVIDATRDDVALVPEEFRAVQWTRLPAGETNPAFCAKLKKMLDGEGRDASPRRPSPDSDEKRGRLGETSLPTKSSRPWLVPAILAVAVALVIAIWQPWRNQGGPASSMAGTASPNLAQPSKPAPETAASLAEQARNHYYPFSTPDSLQLAEESGRRATDLDPQYARGWGVRAGANARYLLRGFVNGEAAQQRGRDAQSFANRALALDKNETEALIALGLVARRQNALGQAETLFRRVLAVDPNNVQVPSLLSTVLTLTDRNAEALVLMKSAVERAPRDPVLHLFLGFVYWSGWNFSKAAAQFETAATVADFPGARVYRAWVLFLQSGDLARLRTMLEEENLIYSAEDGKLAYLLDCGLYERRADRVLEAVGRSANTYFESESMPKAWFSALAYEIDRKDNLARQQWLAAEAVVRERLRAEPQDEILRMNLAITLAKLGRAAEARPDFDAIEAGWREQASPVRAHWLARFYAVTGDAARAVAWLRQSVNRLSANYNSVTVRTLPLDPWWDPIRNTEEFRAFLATPPAPPQPIDEPAPSDGNTSMAKPDQKSVAVLAFDNLSGDKDNEYFSDGISDELGNQLGKVPGLRVAGRTSAFSFKGKNVPEAEIAQKLGVAYIVNGTVQKSGTQVRITARLINAADGFQIWSDKFTKELKDVFVLEDEIAGLIAQNLSLKLGYAARPAKVVNPDAHRLVLEGRHFSRLRTTDDFARAEAVFRKALELDPGFAQAHAGLGEVGVMRAAYAMQDGATQREVEADMKLGQTEGERARELDLSMNEAVAVLGYHAILEWRFDVAERQFQKALTLDPNNAATHIWRATLKLCQGQLDEATRELEESTAIDPLWATNLANYAEELVLCQRFAEALPIADRVVALRPDILVMNLGNRCRALYALGRKDEAIETARLIRRNLTKNPRRDADSSAIWVLRQAGLEREASDYGNELLTTLPPATQQRGFVLGALGRFEEALPHLEHTPSISRRRLYWDAIWDPWRQDLRFQQLMVKLGCVEEYKVARETLARMLKEQAAKK